MSMKIKERISAIIIFSLFAFAFFYSRSYPSIPKMVPTIVSLTGMLLSISLFVRTFSSKHNAEEGKKTPSNKEISEDKKEQNKTFIAMAMLVVYILLIRVIGFYITSLIFINTLAYIIDGKNQKWWTYPVVSISILGFVYLVFGLFIKISFPRGFLF